MTYGPKTAKPSKADEGTAYELATLRDKGTCQKCRRPGRTVHRDHRQNRQPGNTVTSNLQLLCVEDHLWKTEHPRLALEEGWAVPSWGDPAEWPARRYVSTDFGTLRPAWVIYDNAGDWFEITDAEAMERMKGAGW